jgi:hypothetical protein
MSNRLVAAFFGVCIAISIGCSTAAAADDHQPAVSVYTMSPGRLEAIAAGVMGLTGVVLGGRALRSAGRIGAGSGRRGAIMALVAGLIGVTFGGLVVAAAKGGIGTGNGLGGGVVALVLGLIGMALGGLALARSGRRVGQCYPKPIPHQSTE